jgi:dipeptidyl aminopeptidase/acylaminoacyl peptidase
MNRLLIFCLGFILFISCSSRLTSNKLTNTPTQSVFFFRDKEGIYEYDWATNEEKIVFKATDTQIFREEPCRSANDTLTFALKGILAFDKNHDETYFDDYISVDLKSGRTWRSSRTSYEVVSKSIINIASESIDKDGIFTVESKISKTWHNASYTSKGPTYNELGLYSTSTVGDQTVFTSKGDLFVVNKSDTTVLINYEGEFDFKFGNGYYQPQISPTGQFVIVRYLPGYEDPKERQSLQRIDLLTKEITKIKDGGYGSPTFSKDGNYILFKRNQRYKRKNRTWLSSVYVLDLRTNEEQKIGKGDIAAWK